ncbi:hypothetical protein DGMP_15880 [Desulfomarina profundi]|uniref:Uncharacterized protein n=1 Tax=Desulfomarina profundi TaxID=2772557 RepID=A0A8D5FHQ7_9BACT|nr:hypothetical protein [Desulfomarina profundi]BCL60895.1 hypothetical protein DGMP_15880 [Desulfomarina profundi]
MSNYSIHPPGDKVKKAIREFSEKVQEFPDKTRQEILHEVELKYDLSPQECEFLNNHFQKE